MKAKPKEEPAKPVAEAEEAQAPETKAAEAAAPELTPKAKKMLQIFKHLDFAYIDEKGGVFSLDTPEHMRGDAVLHKNPYFKQ